VNGVQTVELYGANPEIRLRDMLAKLATPPDPSDQRTDAVAMPPSFRERAEP
jgi:hypothetical protein